MKHITIVWIGLLAGLLSATIFRWIGLPTGDKLLEALLGKSTWWKGIILFSIMAFTLFLIFSNAFRKDKEKT